MDGGGLVACTGRCDGAAAEAAAAVVEIGLWPWHDTKLVNKQLLTCPEHIRLRRVRVRVSLREALYLYLARDPAVSVSVSVIGLGKRPTSEGKLALIVRALSGQKST